jgi:para-nitrobenzyl esterase
MNADLWFLLAAHDLADVQSTHNPRTYRYVFAWRSPAFGGALGAAHGMELPFVFDHFEPLRLFTGDEPPAVLAKTMQHAWVSFARTGDPGWPAWSATSREVMRFDEDSAVVHDPHAPKVALWKAIYPNLLA